MAKPVHASPYEYFESLTHRLSNRKVGVASLSRFTMTETDEMFTAFHGGWQYCPAGEYIRLIVRGVVVMSNTRMERITNLEVVLRANGNVFLAGLGMGMVLFPILDKPEVNRVVVLEKEPDVIKLMDPFLRHQSKLLIIQGDVFQWRPPAGVLYDTIYFDIWSTMSEDNLPAMAKLHQQWKYYKNRSNPNAWMGSWSQNEMRAQKRSSGW